MTARPLLPLIVGLLAAVPASAIYVNHAATGLNDGETWDDAYTDLSEAIANTFPPDEIWVAQGTYKPGVLRTDSHVLKADLKIYGGFVGGETLREQRDPAANETILSGDIGNVGDPSDNCYHVVDASATNAASLLDGFTVRDGQADGAGTDDRGAGVFFGFFTGGNGMLDDIRFENNHASFYGGAVTTRIPGNVIQNCRFTGNTCDGAGGAIAVLDGSETEISGCSFDGNSVPMEAADSGGAVFIRPGSSAAIDRCSFQNNIAQFGGAVGCNGGMSVSTCSFRGNHVGRWGGAVYVNSSEDPLIYNSEFVGNRAEELGGAYTAENGNAFITNCSFEGNAAGLGVGGAYLKDTNPVISNTVMWHNSEAGLTHTASASISGSSAGVTYHHCLIQGINPPGINNWNATNLPADIPFFLDPLDPAQAPATGGNLTLQTGSFAENWGDNNVDLDGPGPGTDTVADLAGDLGGNARIIDGMVDLGAHEGALLMTFANVYPGLDPNGDANTNGVSNFADYAQGIDPTARPPTAYLLRFRNRYVLLYSERIHADDVQRELQQSGTLQGWSTMSKGAEYLEFSRTIVSPTRYEVLIGVTSPAALGHLFARQILTQL